MVKQTLRIRTNINRVGVVCILRWFLSLSVLAASLAAQAQQISGTITVFTNRSDLVSNGSFKRWSAEFERRYPGTTVKVRALPDYDVSVAPLFEERRYGDVVVVPNDLPKEAYPKYFVPLDDMGLSKRMYFSDAWAYQGKEYAYTQGVSAEGLIYNKQLFKKLGIKRPPKTLDEFYEVCEQIKSAGSTPLTLNVGAQWTLQQWDKLVVLLSGDESYYGKMVNDMSPFDPGKPYAKSFEIAHTIFSRGYSEPDFIFNQWEDSKVNFVKGQIGMYFMGSWLIPQLIGSGMSTRNVGFAPMPIDNSGTAKALLNVDRGLAVNRNSKNKYTAKKYIEFILTISDFADVSGYIPTDQNRSSGQPQLTEYMSYKPVVIESAAVDNDFLRIANKAGMDFLEGNYVRDILVSASLEGSLKYWNDRWKQAASRGQQ